MTSGLFFARLHKVLIFASIGLLLAMIIMLAKDILMPLDVDVQHEMYFGQRLLAGELLWTREFHDKLPFLPFLFALPAGLESTQLHRLFSFLVVAMAGTCFCIMAPAASGLPAQAAKARRALQAFAGISFLTVLLYLPGGLTTINTMATAFALIGILAVRKTVWDEPRDASARVLLVFGSLCAAMAISIRPYFFALCVVLFLWAGYEMYRSRRNLRDVLRFFMVWGGALAAWGFVLNILPYVVTGQFTAFLDGMSMLAGGNIPHSGASGFRTAWKEDSVSDVGKVCMALTLVSVLAFRRGGRGDSLLVLTLLSGLALAAAMLTAHVWGHYTQMFAGLFCLLVVNFMERVMAADMYPKLVKAVQWFALAVPCIFGYVMLEHAYAVVADFSKNGAPTDTDISRARLVEDYLQRTNSQNETFLAPTDMALHWRLWQSRHGFPHASHTHHIFSGWWKTVGPYKSFATPQSAEEYCRLLEEKGPTLLIDPLKDAGLECVTQPDTVYTLSEELTYPPGKSLSIYRRTPKNPVQGLDKVK